MQIDRAAKDAVVALMKEKIASLKDDISKPKPQDNMDKDNAATWWNRGQIFALSKMIETIMEDDNEH